MKLILRADVEKLGNLGDVVNVKAGYARNWLLPQGLAMTAGPSNLKVFELERKKLEARMDAVRAEAKDMQARLEALEVVISVHVGENEKLYGSVTTSIIGDALAALGVEIDRRRILLDAPIRQLGEYSVRVRLHASVVAVVPVKVVSDSRVEQEQPAARDIAGESGPDGKAVEQAAEQ
ncbi:MAG: 50S ribosomal protein L9 [Desulfovibrio sp.]|jgi:large subunit ribosomal protein L9|nr:50S ribosomal protein L9 [Desulfovibrio sp.]